LTTIATALDDNCVLGRVRLLHIFGIGRVDKSPDVNKRKSRTDRALGQFVGARLGLDEHVVILIDHMHGLIAAADVRQGDPHRH
jgi:hypothetical protein